MSFHRLVLVFVAMISFFQPALAATISFVPPHMQRFLKIEYFENCDHNVYPIMFSNFTFVRNGSDMIMNGEMIISRDIKSPTKVEIPIIKCRDKSNPDTCEYNITWKFDDACDIFRLPVMEVVRKAVTPPFLCPIKRNHHHVKNARVATSLVEMFFAHGNPNMLWKVRLIILEDKNVVGCAHFGDRFVNVRARG